MVRGYGAAAGSALTAAGGSPTGGLPAVRRSVRDGGGAVKVRGRKRGRPKPAPWGPRGTLCKGAHLEVQPDWHRPPAGRPGRSQTPMRRPRPVRLVRQSWGLWRGCCLGPVRLPDGCSRCPQGGGDCVQKPQTPTAIPRPHRTGRPRESGRRPRHPGVTPAGSPGGSSYRGAFAHLPPDPLHSAGAQTEAAGNLQDALAGP